MSFSRLLGILIASALLALLVLAPSDARVRAGAGEPPPNDDFADETVIIELPYSDSVDIGEATVEAGEATPSCNFGGVFSTIWYRYTPPNGTVLVAGASTGGANTAMAVWTEGDSGLAEVTCDGFFGAALKARLAFQAEAGVTYFFQVDVVAMNPSAKTVFTLDSATPPANDNFIDATEISTLPFSDAMNNGAATQEHNEPVACVCGKFAVPPLATVWYAFTPDVDAVIVADTAGSDFNTVINVLLPGDLGPRAIGCAASQSRFPPARLGFEVEAGQLYYFQVGGAPFDAGFGNLSFELSVGVPPANDDFTSAVEVTGLPFEAGVDTIAAGLQAEEPAPSCAPRGVASSVWYRVSTIERSLIIAEATGGAFSPIIGVYQGNELGGLTQVVCGRRDFPATLVGFEADAGETYYLQVAGVSRKRTSSAGAAETAAFGNGGDVTLRVSALEIPECPAADFSVTDRTGDVQIFLTPPDPERRHDILSSTVGMTSEHVCLRFDFAARVDPPDAGTEHAINGILYRDTDSSTSTGYTPFLCGWERELGVDVTFDLSDGTGQFLRLLRGGVSRDEQFGIAIIEEQSMTLIFSQEIVGGDSAFRFVLKASNPAGGGEDCAPDRSFIQVPPPAIGDANCDGAVDARDSVIILQFFARLLLSLPCESVADANGNGTIGSVDAALILHFSAGLINVLPGEAREAIAAVVQLTAANRGISKEQIEVGSVSAEIWPDACLGLGQPAEDCAEVTTPGYRVWVSFDLEGIAYRTDLTGSIIRVEGGFIV